MIQIYADAAYDLSNKIACYCIVVVDEITGKKHWEVHRIQDATTSNDAETAAVRHALELAEPYRKAGEMVVVYSDCNSALSRCGPTAKATNVFLRHVHGHMLERPGEAVTDNRKRQHWADIMAYKELQKVLDLNKHERIVKV